MIKIVVGDISSQIEHPESHPVELVKLREICRAKPENFMFMPKYKAGLWDGYISLLHGFAAFPTGLLGLVTKGFDRWKIQYQITKPEDTATPPTVTADMLTGVTLRDYQVEAANVMLARKRGILRMATNSGKTEVMAAVIKTLNVNTLVVVHRKELMYQTAERFANRGVMDPKDIGIIGDGHFDPKKLTVGMIQSLFSHRDKTRSAFIGNKLLITDECFVAGTLVDGKPIETIKVGDVVSVFDKNNSFQLSKVTQVFSRKAPKVLVKITFSSTTLICTREHPVYTSHGWCAAKDLRKGDIVYGNPMSSLQEGDRESRKIHAGESGGWLSSTLLGWLQKLHTHVRDQGAHAQSQSNAQEGCSGQGQCIFEGHSSQTHSSWRERQSSYKTTVTVGDGIGVGYGSIYPYEATSAFRLPNMLQSGHRQQGFEARCGSRWWLSQLTEPKSVGSEKRCFSSYARVEGVEVLKSDSTGEYERVCSDGKVYNIETETFHTYFANGIAVHNCHHLSNDTMMSILSTIPGPYRFGLSGTPLRYEVLADMKVISITGDLIYDLDNAYLIAEGYSARPIVHIGVVELKDERWWKADYQTAYDTLLVHNEQRNQKIADFALAQHGTVLILVDRIEHGLILQGLMPYATYVTGSDTTARRRGVLDNMREAKDGIYIATPIFDEGVDVPGVNAVVIAGGGASSIRVLQRIGRGLRHKEGINQLNVLDFVDDVNLHLFNHSDARITTYVEEGFETVMDD